MPAYDWRALDEVLDDALIGRACDGVAAACELRRRTPGAVAGRAESLALD